MSGLGILPGMVRRFPVTSLAVPNINWSLGTSLWHAVGVRSGVAPMLTEPWPLEKEQPRCYFVHSYRVAMPDGFAPWVCDPDSTWLWAARHLRAQSMVSASSALFAKGTVWPLSSTQRLGQVTRVV